MKNVFRGFGLVLVLMATSAHAIPTLFFDGDIDYSSATGELAVTSVLTATTDISPAPELVGSSLIFSAILQAVDASSSSVTIGLFDGVNGDDISVIDGALNSLLEGEFASLQMLGRNGRDAGRVTGVVNANDGLLAGMFGAGNLIALEFNLSTVFSADMFSTDFTGAIDGRIEGEAVPEPNILVLLGLGFALIGFTRSRRL